MLLELAWAAVLIAALYIAYSLLTGRKSATVNGILRSSLRKSKEERIKPYMENFRFQFTRVDNPWKIIIPLVIAIVIAAVLYNYVFFVAVNSNSMAPTFERGDLVLMQSFDKTPHVGDVVIFKIYGFRLPFTHRVYSITDAGIRTMGDNNPGPDNWVITPQHVGGKMVLVGGKPVVIKYLGYYFLDAPPTETFAGEFRFLQYLVSEGRELGLLIFSICLVLYLLLSINEQMKMREARKRKVIQNRR
ncbi:MAG TPA: signal peptidase I [Candidatus Methanoperedenaceae archaeon]|nr:signal peptidase I [Candidatus Methanoperedenaceae archaeon]